MSVPVGSSFPLSAINAPFNTVEEETRVIKPPEKQNTRNDGEPGARGGQHISSCPCRVVGLGQEVEQLSRNRKVASSIPNSS